MGFLVLGALCSAGTWPKLSLPPRDTLSSSPPAALSAPPGTNMLMVGVHGPKTPCEEVYVKHMGNRVYNVTYTVKEKGDYVLILKWGDEGVPGSPYQVTVP